MASILCLHLGSPELGRAPLSAVFWGLGAGEHLSLRMHSCSSAWETQESADWTLTLVGLGELGCPFPLTR